MRLLEFDSVIEDVLTALIFYFSFTLPRVSDLLTYFDAVTLILRSLVVPGVSLLVNIYSSLIFILW